jgi:hypothetical protein
LDKILMLTRWKCQSYSCTFAKVPALSLSVVPHARSPGIEADGELRGNTGAPDSAVFECHKSCKLSKPRVTAVHPPDFVGAFVCRHYRARTLFGPPVEAVREMGDNRSAKQLA